MTVPTALYDQRPVGAVVCTNASLAHAEEPRVSYRGTEQFLPNFLVADYLAEK